YPRGVVVVSPDVAARHDCLSPAPPKNATWKQVLDITFPVGCAAENRFYSIRLTNRSKGVAAALGAYDRRAVDLGAQLPVLTNDPDFPRTENLSYLQLSTATADEQRRV